MTIIALDPGISTGVAVHIGERWSNDTDTTPDEYVALVITKITDIWDVIDKHQPTVVVYENFASGGLISKDGQATLRLVGAIEVVCYRLGIPTMLQYPAERYPFIPIAREMLKQIKRTPISHEVDALSHLLLYEHRQAHGLLDIYTKRQRQI